MGCCGSKKKTTKTDETPAEETAASVEMDSKSVEIRLEEEDKPAIDATKKASMTPIVETSVEDKTKSEKSKRSEKKSKKKAAEKNLNSLGLMAEPSEQPSDPFGQKKPSSPPIPEKKSTESISKPSVSVIESQRGIVPPKPDSKRSSVGKSSLSYPKEPVELPRKLKEGNAEEQKMLESMDYLPRNTDSITARDSN